MERLGQRRQSHGRNGFCYKLYNQCRPAQQLVWTGNATKTVDPGSNQEKNMKNLNKAIAKLLKDYPPKQK